MQDCDGGVVEHGDEISEVEEISKRYGVFNAGFCGLLNGRREAQDRIPVHLPWMMDPERSS